MSTVIGSWTISKDKDLHVAALACARGCYQRALLMGHEALSGSMLCGKASRYAGRYRASRDNLLSRMTAAGIPWTEARGTHGKRILVIGRAEKAAAILGGTPAQIGAMVAA